MFNCVYNLTTNHFNNFARVKIHTAVTECSFSANHVGLGFTITGTVVSSIDEMFEHKASEQH